VRASIKLALASAMVVMTVIADAPVATAFSTGNHRRITRNAFPFMAGGVLDTIVAGNDDEDEGKEKDFAERHGCNCLFRASAKYANMRYQQVVDALREPQAQDPDRAARLFGHILHGVQDFYAHSNWIPTPPQGLGIRGRLLDAGLGEWKVLEPYSTLFDDVVVIEGNPPADVSVRLPTDSAGRVSSAVPIVIDRRRIVTTATAARGGVDVASAQRFRGLMTAGAPREGVAQLCPPAGGDCNISSAENVCLRHGDSRDSDTSRRNFDGAGSMNMDGDGEGDWFEARHHAKLQTRHEWCRLLHRSRDLDPSFVAAGRLLGNWVAKDSGNDTPHIPGTACARGAARHHLVEITAKTGDGAPGEVPFVVVRSDFSSSARASAKRGAATTLKICGDTNEQIAATLVPPRARGVSLLVPVPGTARAWTVRDHRGGFKVSFTIKVTPNAC
jgi:hypothetical protein